MTSKFIKGLGIIALALIINVGAAQARGPHGGGGWHGGGGHVGGWRDGGGWYGGWGPSWGPDYHYEPIDCGWVPVRVLHHGHWVVRHVWRCW